LNYNVCISSQSPGPGGDTLWEEFGALLSSEGNNQWLPIVCCSEYMMYSGVLDGERFISSLPVGVSVPLRFILLQCGVDPSAKGLLNMHALTGITASHSFLQAISIHVLYAGRNDVIRTLRNERIDELEFLKLEVSFIH